MAEQIITLRVKYTPRADGTQTHYEPLAWDWSHVLHRAIGVQKPEVEVLQVGPLTLEPGEEASVVPGMDTRIEAWEEQRREADG